MKLTKPVFAFALFILILNDFASAQNNKALQIDSLIHKANSIGIFNGNILVVDHGQVVYKGAVGFTDASSQTKLTTQYRFHIGSIAKEFNAIGIMMLKEQGKLSLDDELSKYFPELPAWADSISIKNLLQYTSGLPDVKWRTVKNDADNWNDIKEIKKLDFEPGKSYAYNNNNVFMQRRIIEKITGIPFSEFVEQKMLKPCGMASAIVDPTDQDTLIAKSYNDSHQQDGLAYPISGWTCVTLDDFYKWAQCIESFKLIGPASTLEIITPIAPGKQCGLGEGVMKQGRLISHVHDGTAQHYQALLASYIPDERTVILLTNNKQDNVYEINTAIQNILNDKPYQQPAKSLLKVYQKQIDTINGKQLVDLYNKLKTQYPQTYGFDNESTLNELGYYLMGNSRMEDAILVFKLNTKLFPASGNVFDSLGEAYYKSGDKKNALLNYQMSVKLDPTNSSGKEIISQLQKP